MKKVEVKIGQQELIVLLVATNLKIFEPSLLLFFFFHVYDPFEIN